ncbi:MAG: DUF3438 family protein [Pseudomonadota bacterium]
MKRLLAACLAVILIASAFLPAFVPGTVIAQGPPGGRIERLDLRDTTVSEAVRLIAELSGANVIATGEAGDRRVSMVVRDTTVRGAISSIARVSGLSFTYDSETEAYLLLTQRQFANEVVVIRDGDTRIFTLRHQNVVTAARIIRSLFGSRVSLDIDTADPDALVIADTPIQASRTVGNTNNTSSSSDDDDDEDGEDLDPDTLTPDQILQVLGINRPGEVAVSDAAEFLGLEPTIFITVNRDHNLLFVRTADETALDEIQKIIRVSDRPTKQVLLEMKILSLDLDDDFRSIFNFGLASDDDETFISPRGNGTTGRSGTVLGDFALEAGTLFFQFISANLFSQIELLERQGRVRTVATPLLVAANNSPAELFVGAETVLVRGFESDTVVNENSTITTNTTETEIREVGQTLEILPRINGDGTITLAVRQESSTVIRGGATIPTLGEGGDPIVVDIDTVSTARVAGTVTALNGTTIAFGGLINESRAVVNEQVPVLGDVPGLGTLFRGDTEAQERSELVIMLTPHVYSTAGAGEPISRQALARLSRNPDIDRGGFGGSDGATPVTQPSADRQSFVELTRFAAAMAHGTLPPRGGVYDGIVPTDLRSSAPTVFGLSGGVVAEPVAIWRKGGTYVTTVVLENALDTVVTLDLRQLRGNWLAATLESDILAPRGQVGSRNYVYLLSAEPYEEVVGRAGPGGAL